MTSNDLNPTACSPRVGISDLTSDNVNADNVNADNVNAVNKNAINENAIDKLTASVIVFLAVLIRCRSMSAGRMLVEMTGGRHM